jgi:hypothetical protein
MKVVMNKLKNRHRVTKRMAMISQKWILKILKRQYSVTPVWVEEVVAG